MFDQAPVVEKVDKSLSTYYLLLIHWIAIYPVDSAIQLLNNWGQLSTNSHPTLD